ncbi:MAG: phenylalanine--tRNA ligase subunit beta [Candidatus Micrarchaeota archaeon]
MATTEIRKGYLLKLLGRKVSDQHLEEALHQIKAPINSSDGDMLAIEVTGDRPDLLSAEGIARSLKGYFGFEKGLPEEKFQKGDCIVHVDQSVKGIRGHIVGAVIENVKITAEDLTDLIQIQEKLTLTHGRKRKKVAIGLHDMKSLSAPFNYKAVDPDSVSFIPLGKTQKMTMREIVDSHEKGIEYGGIVSNFKKWPLITDSKNQVLSFPPVINGALTGLSTSTKSIFVDITGTDFHACNIALNIICQDFYGRGAVVKTVEVKSGPKPIITPQTAPERMELDVGNANRLLGTDLSPKQIIDSLGKQRISATIKNIETLDCLIPRYRADFLHPVDLVEEIALGFGYNNFVPKPPSVFTKGSLLFRTTFVGKIEDLMAGDGYLQVNSPILTNARVSNKVNSENGLIKISNPVSEEYENVRSSLLPQLLEALSKNSHNPYPQRLFEVGFVSVGNPKNATRASNDLHLAAVVADSKANLADITRTLMELLKSLGSSYGISKSELKMFIPGRQAKFKVQTAKFKNLGNGHFGEIHPSVLENLKLEVPVAAFEIDVEGFASR